MFPILGLLSTGLSAFGQLAGGMAAKQSAELEAFNIETQRITNRIEAQQRHNDRVEQFSSNLATNLANLAASGRDISTGKSVEAFLNRQTEIVGRDINRSDFMGMMQDLTLAQEKQRAISRGNAAMASAFIGATTSIISGLHQYNQVRVGSPSGSSLRRNSFFSN